MDGAVDLVTNLTTFAQCLMLESKRASFVLVAFEARFVDTVHRRRGPRPHFWAVRVVAIRTAHFAF